MLSVVSYQLSDKAGKKELSIIDRQLSDFLPQITDNRQQITDNTPYAFTRNRPRHIIHQSFSY